MARSSLLSFDMIRQLASGTLRLLVLPMAVASLAVCTPPLASGSDSSSEAKGDGDSDSADGDGRAGTSKANGDSSGDSTSVASGDAGSPAGPVGKECAGDAFDEGRLRADLTYLASSDLAGRSPGSAGDASARKFIEDRFRCLGLKPGGTDGTFLQAFTDSDGNKSSNVIGILPGSDPKLSKEFVIVGAHRDHFGRTDQEECTGLCLGANDNGSGTATVLALAQAMRLRQTAPKRTIAFFLFSSEELGCEGSHYYVKHPTPAIPLASVVYDINFDMVGSYTQWGKRVVAHGTVGNTPGLAEIKPLIAPSGLNMEINVPGIEEDDSDYYPFCVAGIPMVSFFTHDPKCYHRSCDTIEKIDFPNMAKIAKVGSDLAGRLGDTATDLVAFRKSAKVSQLGCTGFPNPAD
jgi:hypothetical protein